MNIGKPIKIINEPEPIPMIEVEPLPERECVPVRVTPVRKEETISI